jgi:transketolase C-terminal domain/subunit
VAKALAEAGHMPRLLRIGLQDCFGQSGTADELLQDYSLTPAHVAKQIQSAP